ncbi:metallophosphoesterase [Cyanobium sp. Morenito 9A2]|uniref:metallophosphoesterase n=1 Tax=Cyanobium sp. Morenito 9A2 TaxID=2823718 RepID=UPI0020CE67D0|nr:metallophosphoesterase [Cyanobium sp. Morenito 9A2]MCP9851019.1 serine/threonine protein phosphatase [Cyanobium sp. Morenito 9A2]
MLTQGNDVVAIGDVHGCASLLRQELEKYRDSGAEIILLGDLLDRSPEDGGARAVLEHVWAIQADPGAYGLKALSVIRGNHEQMAIDALAQGETGEASDLWFWNGGDLSVTGLLRERMDWLTSLPHYLIRGDYLFVHAGVRPGIPLEQQSMDDMLWIRQPFLGQPHGLRYVVVHGHSITASKQVERKPWRIGIDTGAFLTGKLSSLRISPGG